jgi:glutathione synthase/RimK-type ligase-like ATP-grasp enzyme
MAKKKVLIITHINDNTSVDKVIDFINAAGGEAIRFNVDNYPMQYALTSSFTNNKWRVTLGDGPTRHELNDVAAVWYRRSFNLGGALKETLPKEYLGPTMREVQHTLFGMLEGLSCFQIAKYSEYRRLDSKEEQLRMAVKHGLRIPATCISNSPEQVKEFVEQQRPVVAKMQSSFAIYRGEKEHVVFTNEISDAHLQELNSLQYCPMTFQQKLDKKLELRVTVVGKEIFAFSIDSQKMANAKVDWRKEGAAMVEDWKPYQLPQEIKDKLLSFMADYKLNYGAIDLILTPDDQYYFLEINSAGEYFWLDMLCDYEISKQIAAVLLGDAERN